MEIRNYNKFKVNINKKVFYILLVISIIYILLLTIHMLFDLSNNTLTAVNQGIRKNSKEMDKFISTATKVWLIQYITGAIFLIMFVSYIVIALNKITVGKVFVIFWLIIWLGFAFVPIIVLKRVTVFDILSILLFIGILISFFFIVKDIYDSKRNYSYKKMKNREYKF
ncbi:hypothetical protein [Mesoplasma seiffertii]|uniref:hypothetical protein n=1 Tax=Mesoplasma seiffertii TaxID=28224 RepID=UPI00047E2844|nr:hypothetical protein [Mesoplasma seiffertii]